MKLVRRILLSVCLLGTFTGAFLFGGMTSYASCGNGSVYVEIPEGWQKRARTLEIKTDPYVVYDTDGKSKEIKVKKVYMAWDSDNYKNVTDSKAVTVEQNGKLKLKAVFEDGTVVTNDYKIDNFDLELPTIEARLEGEILYLKANDTISGVKDIDVNGKVFYDLKDNEMCINIKDLEHTDEYISIHSDDNAGNSSKLYKIKNPYYVGETDQGSEDKSLSNPDSIEATDPTKARGTVTDDFVTQDREFFTVDASGKTFYLIVDRKEATENVYLLTEAGVNDLLNFVDYNGVDVQNGDVPMYEIASNANKKVEPEETPTVEIPKEEEKVPKKETPKKNSATMFVVVVLIVAVGLGYYFLRNKKRKDDLAEAEEMDAFDVPDDQVIEDGEIEYEEDDYFEETQEEEEGPVAEVNTNDTDAEKARLLKYFGKGNSNE